MKLFQRKNFKAKTLEDKVFLIGSFFIYPLAISCILAYLATGKTFLCIWLGRGMVAMWLITGLALLSIATIRFAQRLF